MVHQNSSEYNDLKVEDLINLFDLIREIRALMKMGNIPSYSHSICKFLNYYKIFYLLLLF